MKKNYILLIKCFAILFIAMNVNWSYGQYSCTSPSSVTVGTCNTLGTSGSNTDYWNGATGCNAADGDDAWASFVATSTSTTITYYSADDAIIHLFSGTCATNMSALTCSDQFAAGDTEFITYATTIGTTYYVRMQRFNSDSNMTGTLCVHNTLANDNCGGAIALTVNSGTTCTSTTSGTTVGATQSQAGCAGTADDDVWYTFVATATSHTVVVTPGTLSDAVLQVFSGACGSLTSLDCEDATVGSAVETTTLTGLTIGNTYRVRVYSFGSGSGQGTFTVCVTTPVVYDPCASISNIASCGTNITTTIASGNGAINTSPCGFTTTGKEYIYTFTPATTGTYTINQVSSTITWIDYAFKAVSGGCGTTGWTCIDDLTGASTSAGFTLTAGTQYYIMVDPETSTTGGTVIFNIGCPPTPPVNDDCSGAIALTVGSTCTYATYTNANATATSGVAAPSCASYSGGDVWFSVVVPASGNIAIDTQTGVMTDSGMAIYSGSCGALTEIECDDDDSANGLMSYIIRTGLTPGSTIFIRVWEFGNNNNGTFGICVTDPVITYCTPTSDAPDGLYINSFAFIGTLLDPAANTSTFSGTGYQDFTALTPLAEQAQGEGVNIIAYATGTQHLRGTWKAWVDWNKDGDFTDTGEEVYNIYGFAGSSVTFGFAIPAAQTPGNYRLRIRVNNGTDWLGDETFGFDFSPCDNFTTPGGFSDDDYGETEDYLFKVIAKCNSLITTITDGERCGTGTVSLGATAASGVTEFRWYSALTGGSLIGTSVPTGTSTTWTTPSLSATTTYYVTAWDGSCESQVRTAVVAKISPTPTVSFTPSNPIVCGESAVQITAGGDKEKVFLINEKFDSGLGAFTAINSDANPTATDNKTRFQNRTSVYVPSTNVNVWFPAISSGFGANNFALALSDPSDPDYPSVPVENSLALTSVVNTTDYLNLTLKLKFYYSRYYPSGYQPTQEYAVIELSTNGGTTYPVTIATFTSNQGIGTRFLDLSYDLSAYINQPNLKIRVRHYADASASGWLPGGVAVDNIELFGEKPLNTAFNYDTAVVQAFTDAGCTSSYTPGTPATTIWIKPTLAQLENATFTIPVDAVLSNGCSATGSIDVTNNTKIFKAGTAGTDWNTATNWSPVGVPTANNCVIIIDDDVNVTGTAYNGLGLNLTVKPTGNLNIASSNSVTITDFVQVDAGGVFQIEDDASLVQVNNVANTGNIIYKRIAAAVRGLDYVYWASPVANQALTGIYTTPTQGPKYIWNTTVANSNNGYGNWQAASGNMLTAKGYIVRGSSSSGMAATDITSTFTGVPNNGNITFQVTKGTYTGPNYDGTNGTEITNLSDNWNLVGNPYPSSIRASQFLYDNRNIIEGDVLLWTHGQLPTNISSPFYGTYTYNYDPNDYLTFNFTGSSCCPALGSDLLIASGQGFFIKMKDDVAVTAPANISFNNGLRSATYVNDDFYRTATPATTTPNSADDLVNLERNRIWLDIIGTTQTQRSLIGYVQTATNDKDSFFDSTTGVVPNVLSMYSIVGGDKFLIQGRELPFNVNDLVPMGVYIPTAGNYSIAIASVDGLFENNQDIYIEDHYLNIIHDLRVNPYSFTSDIGEFNDRFTLRYTNETLSNQEFSSNNVMVITNDFVIIKSTNKNIKSVIVHDVLGRLLNTYESVDATECILKKTQKNNAPLLLQITLEDGSLVKQKVLY